jgi:hypothetical protein
MIGRIKAAGVTIALGLAVVPTAAAQPSRFEVSGGYQPTRAAAQTLPVGWSVDIATRLDGAWGIVGEVSGAYKVEADGDLGVDVKRSLHSFGAGARWSRRDAAIVVPFLQVLAGAARVGARAEILGTPVGGSSTRFMLQPGGGVTVRLNETIGLVGQVDYRRVFFDEKERPGANHLRVVVGVRLAP